jgi:hypothetical protein
MRAQVIEAPENPFLDYPVSLFLAGGITNCYDWQKDVIARIGEYPISIFNPRRVGFDLSNKFDSRIQREWEFGRLRRANVIFFWFAPETLCPITLFELGAALERGQKLIIGCHPDYARKDDVCHQCEMKGFVVSENFDVAVLRL